ncbi:hypothetical protein MARI151_20692 [Maribacter litoralis]|uniref:Uncharacterized protein n=1 Tax=Maribacter litoralis TaxID=2059726 RepID=A0A653QYI0_9FLAO|nr:hypothetical protein MARI151_20692 [Maribacter litoralis]
MIRKKKLNKKCPPKFDGHFWYLTFLLLKDYITLSYVNSYT